MIDRIIWKLTTLWSRYDLQRRGAKLGAAVRFKGLPIVSGAFNRISIGARAVFNSTPSGTALGVRCPCILRTFGPEGRITIGEDTGISGAAICSAASVSIGARCLIGADVMIFDTDFHHHEAEGRRSTTPDWASISTPVVIEDDVFLGARVTVSKGAHIGRGSIIGVGSLVTGTIPPMSIAVGSPAKVIGKVPPGRAGSPADTVSE